MAIKRFDDIDKKARELEAQAKKLRREKQAAKTKAYADALVAVFPEVKEMGSAEEVLSASRASVPSAVPSIKTRRRFGHGESSPCPTFGRVVLSDRTC